MRFHERSWRFRTLGIMSKCTSRNLFRYGGLKTMGSCTILCFNFHTTVEFLKKNVSIGQLLQHIPNSIVVRPKR